MSGGGGGSVGLEDFTVGFTIHECRDMITDDGNAFDPQIEKKTYS